MKIFITDLLRTNIHFFSFSCTPPQILLRTFLETPVFLVLSLISL